MNRDGMTACLPKLLTRVEETTRAQRTKRTVTSLPTYLRYCTVPYRTDYFPTTPTVCCCREGTMRAEYSQQHDHDHHLIVFFFERNQSGVGGCKDRLGLFASLCIEERNDGFGDDFVKIRTYQQRAVPNEQAG